MEPAPAPGVPLVDNLNVLSGDSQNQIEIVVRPLIGFVVIIYLSIVSWSISTFAGFIQLVTLGPRINAIYCGYGYYRICDEEVVLAGYVVSAILEFILSGIFLAVSIIILYLVCKKWVLKINAIEGKFSAQSTGFGCCFFRCSPHAKEIQLDQIVSFTGVDLCSFGRFTFQINTATGPPVRLPLLYMTEWDHARLRSFLNTWRQSRGMPVGFDAVVAPVPYIAAVTLPQHVPMVTLGGGEGGGGGSSSSSYPPADTGSSSNTFPLTNSCPPSSNIDSLTNSIPTNSSDQLQSESQSQPQSESLSQPHSGE